MAGEPTAHREEEDGPTGEEKEHQRIHESQSESTSVVVRERNDLEKPEWSESSSREGRLRETLFPARARYIPL